MVLTDNQLLYDIMLICSFYGCIVTILTFIPFVKNRNIDKLGNIGLNNNFNSIFYMDIVNKFLTRYSYGIESSIITTIILIIVLSLIMKNIKINKLY